MTRGIVAALVTSAVLLANTEHLAIRVDKYVVMSGTELAVTCIIPRDEHNRSLVAAVDPIVLSMKQIDGDTPQQTYRFPFKKITCEATQARCRLHSNDGRADREVVQRIQMAGCESSE